MTLLFLKDAIGIVFLLDNKPKKKIAPKQMHNYSYLTQPHQLLLLILKNGKASESVITKTETD